MLQTFITGNVTLWYRSSSGVWICVTFSPTFKVSRSSHHHWVRKKKWIWMERAERKWENGKVSVPLRTFLIPGEKLDVFISIWSPSISLLPLFFFPRLISLSFLVPFFFLFKSSNDRATSLTPAPPSGALSPYSLNQLVLAQVSLPVPLFYIPDHSYSSTSLIRFLFIPGELFPLPHWTREGKRVSFHSSFYSLCVLSPVNITISLLNYIKRSLSLSLFLLIIIPSSWFLLPSFSHFYSLTLLILLECVFI